jgi:drug/metabolite transporter (DMT)-like permease
MRVNPFSFNYDNADLLGLLAGIAWALGSVVIRRFPNADFLHITFMQYSVGGLLAGTAAFAMGDVFPEMHRLIAVLPVAFLASTVVFLPSVLLIFRIMQYVSPGLVGILMLSEVLVAALSSWLFLQEALSLSQWAGVLAILGTGVFVGLTEKAAES